MATVEQSTAAPASVLDATDRLLAACADGDLAAAESAIARGADVEGCGSDEHDSPMARRPRGRGATRVATPPRRAALSVAGASGGSGLPGGLSGRGLSGCDAAASRGGRRRARPFASRRRRRGRRVESGPRRRRSRASRTARTLSSCC